VDHQRASGGASALRAAPPRASVPLPGTFTLSENPSTTHLDGGAVVLGGNPLRLFRISERAQRLLARWRIGAAVGDSHPAQMLARRLVSSGAFSPRPAAGRLGPADVTVVVPVRDRPGPLERVLGALAGLDCVVVDDASADAGVTKEIAERHGARVVALSVNRGPAAARNAGLAEAHRPLVAFVDSDCVPTPGWLDPLLGHFDDPVVAAVAPRIVARGGVADGALGRYQAVRSSLDLGPDEGPVRPGAPISYVPSAALVVRHAVVTGAGLFDVTLRGGEDVDLVWRLVESGWDVRYEPSSAVEHDGPATVHSFLARRAFYGSTAAPLSSRHPEAMAPLRVTAWTLAVWLLALARRPLLASAVLAASVAILAHRLRGLVRDPLSVASRIAGGGTVRAAQPALAGLARTWSPALLAGLVCRRTRRASALVLLVPAARDWVRDRHSLDPVRYVALHVADDVSYGVGVWAGCARQRTVVPLVPRVTWRSRVWSTDALRRGLGGRRGQGEPPAP
jgi:mycofactocin glycosyltransferase